MTGDKHSQLEQFIGFLETDPENLILLRDAANVALEANEASIALSLFERLDELQPLEREAANAGGIAAMRSGDQSKAQQWFAKALEEVPKEPNSTFNLAWSKALDGDFEGGATLLDEHVIAALPQAAMLDLQIAHRLGRFDEAATKMDAYVDEHPDYAPLLAAASVLSMDLERPDDARAFAMKAEGHPDALTTLGTLDLGEQSFDQAEKRFAKALAANPNNPRAHIGRGLVSLGRGDAKQAALMLDVGAKRFGDHLGSWIAAGWAYLIADDFESAAERFQLAVDLDPTFGEAQGSLAVIDVVAGRLAEAKRKAQIAARLNPNGFSGALAKILIAQAEDTPDVARKILKRALDQPVLPDGNTLQEAIVKSMASADSKARNV